MMLKALNEQVLKHREILEVLERELAEIDAELDWLSKTEHPDYGKTGFPNVVASLRLGKRKARLVEVVEERRRILDGKIERRKGWLDGKRVVASERARKVAERLSALGVKEREEIGFESGVGLAGYLSEVGGLDGLKELAGEAERKYRVLVVMKELAVMFEDVFDGEEELGEADEELLRVILGAFDEGEKQAETGV